MFETSQSLACFLRLAQHSEMNTSQQQIRGYLDRSDGDTGYPRITDLMQQEQTKLSTNQF
jgi:hypothetical protein